MEPFSLSEWFALRFLWHSESVEVEILNTRYAVVLLRLISVVCSGNWKAKWRLITPK